MTLHVVDASAFGPLFFQDEKDDLFADLPSLISNEQCLVPQHWRLEVSNLILSGMKRKRVSEHMADRLVAEIDLLPIRIDDRTGLNAGESFKLARKHSLSVYDAAYLELALRLHFPLVTYDKVLRQAAVAEDLKVLPA